MAERAIIVCAGEVTREDLAAAAPGSGDLVIGADRGYQRAMELGLVPQIILGDFDSAARPDREDIEVYPAIKDDTDSVLAVNRALEEGCREIVLLGALGGRLDHTVANLQTLVYIRDRGARGWLLGGGTAVTAIRNESLELPRMEGYLSVFAADGPCRGVTLEGLFYPLREAELTSSYPLGVSNQFTAPTARVTVAQGALYVMTVPFDHQ